MSHSDALLIEIGTEELPPKSLKTLGSQFAQNVHDALIAANYAPESFEWFASPRRVAILISRVARTQPDSVVEKRGPAISAAFDAEGNPTKAAMGWARGNGIDVSDAERLVTDKGEWLLHKAEVKGKTLDQSIEDVIAQSLSKLPIPKPMRWGDAPFQFIRPVHTVCVMFGSEVIPATIYDVSSTNKLRGHRFHGNPTFSLTHANEYENTLLNHYVVGSFSRRVDTIKSALEKQASSLGLKADYDTALLEEIASLVEWPKVMKASFEQRFLSVPKEALIYTMKDDQKYVPLIKDDGSLSNEFLFVSNIDSKKPEFVIEGNEKVIRPRLADAEFFFNTDRKRSLESRIDALDTVVFQKQLGTLKEKAVRIQGIAEAIAQSLSSDTQKAARAGLLAKTDLMTEMVMEFPEVQGVMGKYYAQHDGEDDDVAQAIEEQYLPKFAGDALPTSTTGMCVSLADKFDTLVGIFGIGQKPKGDKDPFALRRAAIGVLRIIAENKLPLDLNDLVAIAARQFPEDVINNDSSDVVDFVLSRFSALLQDQSFSVDCIQSVAARRPTAPLDFVERVHAVNAFTALPAAEALSAANKRVANILKKNAVSETDVSVTEALLQEPAEQVLFKKLTALSEQQAKSTEQSHTESLMALAELREPIDAFFDSVMVMADDEALKQNRLALLQQLRTLFLTTADISILAK